METLVHNNGKFVCGGLAASSQSSQVPVYASFLRGMAVSCGI